MIFSSASRPKYSQATLFAFFFTTKLNLVRLVAISCSHSRAHALVPPPSSIAHARLSSSQYTDNVLETTLGLSPIKLWHIRCSCFSHRLQFALTRYALKIPPECQDAHCLVDIKAIEMSGVGHKLSSLPFWSNLQVFVCSLNLLSSLMVNHQYAFDFKRHGSMVSIVVAYLNSRAHSENWGSSLFQCWKPLFLFSSLDTEVGGRINCSNFGCRLWLQRNDQFFLLLKIDYLGWSLEFNHVPAVLDLCACYHKWFDSFTCGLDLQPLIGQIFLHGPRSFFFRDLPLLVFLLCLLCWTNHGSFAEIFT